MDRSGQCRKLGRSQAEKAASAEDIRASVLKEAQSEEIPLAAEDIHVKDEGGHVEISADYTVTVDLHVYQWTLNFHPSATNNPI
jgi:hypothetical protein